MVDSAGRRKPLWHAIRHAYVDRFLTIQPRDGHLALVADNDTDTEWDAKVALTRMAFDGHERSVSLTHTLVPARGTVTVPLAEALTADVSAADEVLVAECDDVRATWFFAEDRDLRLVDAWGSRSVERTDDGYAVHLAATTVQRDVTLLVDKVDPDATVDDGMVTLLPGDQLTLRVRSSAEVEPHHFLDPAVLRSTNQLVDDRASRARHLGVLTHV
jgi:beta-mannosidase